MSIAPRFWFTLVAAIALAVTNAPAQQAPPTFRSGIDAVSVDAFVTDRQGHPVANLTIDDFEIFEDKTAQRITSFTEVSIPIVPPEPYSPTAVESDVATNAAGEGRLYVIVFDELNPTPSLSPGDLALRARTFLRTFIEQHFEASDVGIVVSVGRARAGEMQDFTSNRRLLLNAIDTFSGGMKQSDFEPEPPAFRARAQARALRDLMEALERIQGRRKAVIYVASEVGESAMVRASSDGGLDVANSTLGRANVWDVIDYTGGVRSIAFDDLRAAMTAAMRGGIAFYAFDPAGTAPDMVGSAENLERMGGLRKLSSATGGFAIVNSNSYTQAFPRIVAENSNYYVLGFVSSNDKRDGRYRRLDVRVKRPGLTVRFRDGYIGPSKASDAPEPKARTGLTLSSGVGASIEKPLANSTEPMKAFAAAYRGSGKEANVVVAVELDANRLGLTERGPSVGGEVEVAALAVGATGKLVRGQHERFTLTLRPETWLAAKTAGLRVVTGLVLPPGRYQLRVAGGNVTAPDAGSVMYDLDVPDFSKPALALSPLALTSREAQTVFTVASKSVRAAVPAAPTATRDFSAGDTLAVYAEIYDNRTKDAHRLELVAELRDGAGQRVGRAVTDTRANGQSLQKFEATLPLDLPPGRYVLHVEARSTLEKQPPVSREVPLRVR